MQRNHHSGFNKGFTLAELLIALVILGLVAAFAIPKVLHGQQDSQKKAIFRESLASLYQVAAIGLQEGTLKPAGIQGLFDRNLNYVKKCTSDPSANGCFASSASYSQHTQPNGYVLHNGAMLTSVNGGGCFCGTGDAMALDWNGLAGPNAEGKDQLVFCVLYDTSPTPGKMCHINQVDNNALWAYIWSND